MPAHTPIQKPWELTASPEVLDSFIVELVDRSASDYVEFAPGTPHPNRTLYPGLVLADEKLAEGSTTIVRRYWSGLLNNEDIYNYGVSYGEESTAHPIWARRYLVRRDQYSVLTALSAFTGVFQARVTAVGSGYTTAPTVAFSGGGGSGATAVAILEKGTGAVAWVRVTAEGTGYTTAPTIAFTGGAGSGAAATAVVQGAAKLVHQEQKPLPEDDPRFSLWTTVLRVWKTLPGPTLTNIGFDRGLGHGHRTDTTETDVVAGTTVPVPSFTLGIIEAAYKAEDANQGKLIVATVNGTVIPPVFSTHTDPTTGICVDIRKDVVPGGTKGGVGHVRSLTIAAAGSGYTNGTYDLTFTGTPAAGAIGKATVAGGVITAATLIFGGAGITAIPTVGFTIAGGSGGSITAAIGKGYVEVQEFDEAFSISLTSVLRDGTNGTGTSTLPAALTYAITMRESFPTELRNVKIIAISDTLVRSGYDAVNYSGEVNGRLTEKFFNDADYLAWSTTTGGVQSNGFALRPNLTQFFPQSNRITVTVGAITVNGGAFPDSLHPEVVDTAFGAGVVATLPATSPTVLPHTTSASTGWIVKSIKPERQSIGLWVCSIIEIQVPAY